jgi:hypothetical protein
VDGVQMTDAEIHARRKGRNLVLGLILGGFVLLVFSVTIVKLTEGGQHTPKTQVTQ